jgi:hypothetical protein
MFRPPLVEKRDKSVASGEAEGFQIMGNDSLCNACACFCRRIPLAYRKKSLVNLSGVHPEIGDFWMELSAVSFQHSANLLLSLALADS